MDDASVMPSKEQDEGPIPTAWRSTIQEIVRAIAEGDCALSRPIASVAKPDPKTVEQVRGYLEDYGEKLVALPEETWATSECHWTGFRWELYVELWTLESGRSDLVLLVLVDEVDGGFRFEVDCLYVP